MNTTVPYDKIDYDSYFDRYLQREDAVTALPAEAELREMARKAIVKERLVLEVQPEGTCAQTGDTLTIATVSALPKFNKPRVTVSIGRGLYDKTLEAALVGRKVGEGCTITVKDQTVEATVLEIKRKVVPEPTDEMVVELGETDLQNKPITTVADYEAYISSSQTMSVLSNVNYYVMAELVNDYPIPACDEEDIRILGELEHDAFRAMFLERDGIDLDQATTAQMQEQLGCASFDEFIERRYEWYKMKIQQCLIYGNILGIPLEGKYDPTSRYEVLSDLTDLMYEKLKEEFQRRNG